MAFRRDITVWAIAALALAIRLYGIDWGLPELYEEATPLLRAWDMGGWGPNTRLDPNPHFFNYPSLVLYVQLVGQGILYFVLHAAGSVESGLDYAARFVIDKTPFVVTGRLISTAFATATVIALIALGRQVLKPAFASLAGVLLAVNASHVSNSQLIDVDIPLTFFTVLGLAACIRVMARPSYAASAAAGITVGLAASSKYTGAVLLLPLGFSHVLAAFPPARANHSLSKSSRQLGLAVAAAAAAFIVTSPFVVLDLATFRQHLGVEREHMSLGHFGLMATPSWRFYLESVTQRGLGWPLTLLAFGGLVLTVAPRRQRWALVLGAFFFPYSLAILSWSMKADRYLLPIVPVMLVFAAVPIEAISRRVPQRFRVVVAGGLVLAAIVPLFSRYSEHFEKLAPDTRSIANRWIETHVPSGAFIVVEPYGPPLFAPQAVVQLDPDVRDRVIGLTENWPHYAVQPLPMFQVRPERSRVFYDLGLFEAADIIITSSAVESRYRADPGRFPTQLAFYGELERTYRKMNTFRPLNGPGPVLTLYKNPRTERPFAAREQSAAPPRLEHPRQSATGSEELFYYNYGLNYESFGFFQHALSCYVRAFDYPIVRPQTYHHLLMGQVRCWLAMGRQDEAVRLVDEAAEHAPSDDERESFLDLKKRILESQTP